MPTSTVQQTTKTLRTSLLSFDANIRLQGQTLRELDTLPAIQSMYHELSTRPTTALWRGDVEGTDRARACEVQSLQTPCVSSAHQK